MLEAEGYETASYDGVATLPARDADFACVVVDEKAILPAAAALDALVPAGRPIVVLVDPSRRIVYPQHILCVEKPLLGNAVLTAVGAALAVAAPAENPEPT